MNSDWMDDLVQGDIFFGNNEESTDCYCPYTNGPECALLTMGWQPQELCNSIDCSQLQLFKRRQRNEAA